MPFSVHCICAMPVHFFFTFCIRCVSVLEDIQRLLSSILLFKTVNNYINVTLRAVTKFIKIRNLQVTAAV